ncbi:MAG: hypothetical protein ABR574_13665 [Cryomorphaceae bacterium]
MYKPSMQAIELAKRLGADPEPFVTDENRKRLAEFDEKIKAVQREQKIIEARSWEEARKVVLNS